MSKHSLIFIGICLISPTFWLIINNKSHIWGEWKQTAKFVSQNFNSTSRYEYQQRVNELRWGGQQLHRENMLVKVVYNPIIVVANEFFEFVEFSAPKMFFLAGDGGRLSPSSGQPIPFVLFPLWIIGVVQIINLKANRLGVCLFLASVIGYLLGKRNFEILLFAFFINIAIVTKGIVVIVQKIWRKNI